MAAKNRVLVAPCFAYHARRMGILSIQSSVVAGHVGNSAAAYPLQRLGFETWCIDTVRFSNHPAHGHFTGAVSTPGEIAALVSGLDDLGVFRRCDAVLSGYLGDPETGPIVIDAVARVRASNTKAVFLCDPVIGDRDEPYVQDGVTEFFQDVGVPAADIITPNAYEAGLLTGLSVSSADVALAASDRLRTMGPRLAVITGIEGDGVVTIIASDASGAWQVDTPRVDAEAYGAGDLFSALLLGHHLRGLATNDALAKAASSVSAVLRRAAGSQAKDLPLLAEQEALVAPTRLLKANQIR